MTFTPLCSTHKPSFWKRLAQNGFYLLSNAAYSYLKLIQNIFLLSRRKFHWRVAPARQMRFLPLSGVCTYIVPLAINIGLFTVVSCSAPPKAKYGWKWFIYDKPELRCMFGVIIMCQLSSTLVAPRCRHYGQITFRHFVSDSKKAAKTKKRCSLWEATFSALTICSKQGLVPCCQWATPQITRME